MASKNKKFDFDVYNFTDKRQMTNDIMTKMLRSTQVMFKWSGLPDTIPQRYLELQLQTQGFAGFIEHNGKIYSMTGGLGGEPNEYYDATLMTIANPALKISRQYKIDEEVVVINNDSLRQGLMPIFRMWGSMLCDNLISLRMVDINTRIPYLISAPDDVTKRSADLFIKKIQDGELSVIGEGKTFDGIKTSPYSSASNRPITSLIEYNAFLKAGWLNDIGININGNMKRESLSEDEIDMADDQLHPLVDDMLEQRQIACKKINELFGLNVSVDFSSSWKSNREQLNREIERLELPVESTEAEKTDTDNIETSAEIVEEVAENETE